MQMLYNSDNYVVVEFELPARSGDGPATPLSRGGYEIVDKFARTEIYIEGALAESFKRGVQALSSAHEPSAEQYDDFIAGFTTLAHHPVTLH